MNNVGKWNRWYEGLQGPEQYGDATTYILGARWLSRCARIEDWGCGKGGLLRFVDAARYVGIDGSETPYASTVADLTEYCSRTPGLFMRHVLEHNYEWRKIIKNAVSSFTEKLVLVTFVPLSARGEEAVAFNEELGVPDLALPFGELVGFFAGLTWEHEHIATDTQYGAEDVFYLRI